MPVYDGALAARGHEIAVFGLSSNIVGFSAGAAMLAAVTWLVVRRG